MIFKSLFQTLLLMLTFFTVMLAYHSAGLAGSETCYAAEKRAVVTFGPESMVGTNHSTSRKICRFNVSPRHRNMKNPKKSYRNKLLFTSHSLIWSKKMSGVLRNGNVDMLAISMTSSSTVAAKSNDDLMRILKENHALLSECFAAFEKSNVAFKHLVKKNLFCGIIEADRPINANIRELTASGHDGPSTTIRRTLPSLYVVASGRLYAHTLSVPIVTN